MGETKLRSCAFFRGAIVGRNPRKEALVICSHLGEFLDWRKELSSVGISHFLGTAQKEEIGHTW